MYCSEIVSRVAACAGGGDCLLLKVVHAWKNFPTDVFFLFFIKLGEVQVADV